MSADLQYLFDDLPLFSDGDYQAGFVSGTATIEFENEDSWSVYSLQIELLNCGKHKSVFLEETDGLYPLICAALRKHDSDAILNRIHDALDEADCENGVRPFDPREEWGTHDRAQGIA